MILIVRMKNVNKIKCHGVNTGRTRAAPRSCCRFDGTRRTAHEILCRHLQRNSQTRLSSFHSSVSACLPARRDAPIYIYRCVLPRYATICIYTGTCTGIHECKGHNVVKTHRTRLLWQFAAIYISCFTTTYIARAFTWLTCRLDLHL